MEHIDIVDYTNVSSTSPEDEIGGGTLLWCQVTKRNHGELVGWGVSKCPACKQKVKRPLPQETQASNTAVSTDPTAGRPSQVRYSNKFLWDTGHFSEPWPDLLDLDRDRGKVAMSQGPTDEPVLEVVSVVMTNLGPTPGIKYTTTWFISNLFLGPDCLSKEIIIHSKRVMRVLQTLITYYPDFDLQRLYLRIPQPYILFHQYFEEIKEFQNSFHRLKGHQTGIEPPNSGSERTQLKVCDEETYKHLDIIREFIEGENGREVREEFQRHRQTPAVATYSMLWLLFKPGSKIYVRRLGSPVSAGVVLSVQGGDLKPIKSDPFSIDYWNLDFDGTRLGRCPNNCVVKPFVGEKRISELEVTPCSFYDAEDAGVLRNTLINCGLKYWKFLSGFQVDYRGKLPKEQREWVSLSVHTIVIECTMTLSYDILSKEES